MNSPKRIFWFRQDLRIGDNPGLLAASSNGQILPIYIFDDSQPDFKMGGRSKWWLHHSLTQLNSKLQNNLQIYTGSSINIILELISDLKINEIYFNRCYDPFHLQLDSRLKIELKNLKVEYHDFNGSLLWEPWEVLKEDGTPYRIFTAFYKYGCLRANKPRKPLPTPENFNFLTDPQKKTSIKEIGLILEEKDNKKLNGVWKVGEDGALERLDYFLKHGLKTYREDRDYPSKDGTSRMSPHLHFGEISPHQIYHAVSERKFKLGVSSEDIEKYLTEMAWREFAHSFIYNFPKTIRENFRPKFDQMPWLLNKDHLNAWKKGMTGYPIVDAGMRELLETGYMHNRVRMIAGSFLVKNLLIHWHEGANWFWDNLLDADLANNSMGWQWIAGSGPDAAPYFRIFNPVTQAERFDSLGVYTLKYVPELRNLPKKYLFKPWEAPTSVLKQAKIELGKDYPKPIVNLTASRDRAINAYYMTFPKNKENI